ncbi:MAG TPA: class I SAM-dependent methyltransferase [Acidimicrobiales bacterium]|nr:class I SAM-dependent methyltransferase [Acidimicrobiales bacterium]
MPANRSQYVEPAVAEYSSDHSTPSDALQSELQAETEKSTGAFSGMQIGTDQANLMEMIARAMGATRAIEIGTFTGFSALAIARGMGPRGRLLCCDVSEEWTQIARAYWERAGVSDRIELRIGPAIDTIRSLPADESFDFAFVDADKTSYPDYYEELIPRMRRGGLLLADNTLQSGRVADSAADDPSTIAIRTFNDRAASDSRVEVVLLPIGDGVSFVQKL